MASLTSETLLLGPEGSGKSLLLKRIAELSRIAMIRGSGSDGTKPSKECVFSPEVTVPTQGVDIQTLSFPGLKNLNLREVGSSMASRWDSYFADCDSLIFMIDVSDLGSLASAQVLLLECVSHPSMYGKHVAVVLNKTDLADPVSLVMAENLLRLDELNLLLRMKGGGRGTLLTVLRGSTLQGTSVLLAYEWLIAIHSLSPP